MRDIDILAFALSLLALTAAVIALAKNPDAIMLIKYVWSLL